MFFYSKLYTDITPRRHICLTHARCYFVIYQQFFSLPLPRFAPGLCKTSRAQVKNLTNQTNVYAFFASVIHSNRLLWKDGLSSAVP